MVTARNSLVEWHDGTVDVEIFHKGELFFVSASASVVIWTAWCSALT